MPAHSPPADQAANAGQTQSSALPYGNNQQAQSNTVDNNNQETKNVSVVIPALALPPNITLIRCPPGTVNISGVCKRSELCRGVVGDVAVRF